MILGFSGHPLTFLSATLALIGAVLTMVHVVFTAFLATSPAYFGTQTADFASKIRVGAHEHCCRAAKGSAIAVEGDAAHHHFYVPFLEARACAIRAFVRAVIAGFNTV